VELFLRLTVLLALGLAALIALVFALKVLFAAAVLAAILFVGIVIVRAIRGRASVPVPPIRY
jgi:hypothetical protein